MRRYFRYILLSLVLGICAGSCIEEMEVAQPELDKETLTTLVPRVTSFTNKYVTKADGENLEARISSLVVLVFNNDGAIVHIQQTDANTSSVVLNKSMLDSPQQAGKLSTATVAMIANVAIDNIKDGNGKSIRNIENLSELDSYICSFTEAETVITAPLGSEFKGFPMFGQKTVNLTATKGSHAEEIPLKILYAKVNFEIAVKDGTENSKIIDGNTQFTLDSYSVYNTSTATKLGDITASDTATESDAYGYTSGKVVEMKTGNTATLNSSTVSFTLYVAENRYNHTGLSGIYPNGWLSANDDEDVKGYKDMDEAEKAKPENKLNGVKYFYDDYIQQYKPKLAESSHAATSGDLATYIKLTGTYTDYRGTLWDVNYNIYLGKDNAQNFHVDRNSEYTNKITIKGIRNNDSYSDGQVWVDHRVDVSLGANQGADDCVTITRETLIDSHIEVRPLRVNLPENISVALLYLPKYPKYDGVQIEEIKGGANENWIAIENNNGRVKDITQFSSNGKRKYFTTSLIEQLHLENNDETYGVRVNKFDNDPRKGQRYIQLQMNKVTGEGDCAWIYIDENNSEDDRTAILELVFYNNDREAVMEEKFIIKQKGLHKIENQDLYIETYEEYLHTYDSQDLYTDPTKDYTQRGYNWGLLNTRISMNQYVRQSTLGSTNTDYPYDYFHSEDAEANASYRVLDVSEKDIDLSKNTGLHFTNNAGISQEMTIIDMNTRPESAIQYCLSKNKFRVDESDQEQHTMDIHWYLPDAYEMAQILSDGQEAFSDFKDNAYWTSQPSWRTPSGLNEALAAGYILEDVDSARVVSLSPDGSVSHGSHTHRDELHRIRCAYSKVGIDSVNFSGTRAPEGIGAMRFYMRAWKKWETKEPGYFYFGDWIKTPESDTTIIDSYTEPDTYAFPKVAADDPDNVLGGYKAGYGFKKDPSNPENQKPEIIDELTANYNNYTVFYKWPGLTKYKIVPKRTRRGVTYYDLGDEKKDTKGIENKTYIEYDGDITAGGLKPLDHLHKGDDLSITFIKGNDATHSPKYSYYKDSTIVGRYTTRTWVLPIYTENVDILRNTYSLRTPGGQVQLNPEEKDYYENTLKDYTVNIPFVGNVGYKRQRLENNDGYIYPDEAAARTAGNNATIAINEQGDRVEIPSGISRVVTVESQSVSWYTYFEKNGSGIYATYPEKTQTGTRYRYRITYTIEEDKIPYYEYEKGGEWKEVTDTSNTTITTAPTTDELLMYGGNSFTIKANNGNEISSVKIYFSDSNVVNEDGNIWGNTVHKYLRFTKDGFTGTKDPAGMSYSGDGDKGTMTWSGDPTKEITFKLMSYLKSYNTLLDVWWGSPNSIEYKDSDTESFAHSIVIDQIDVRYKKAE